MQEFKIKKVYQALNVPVGYWDHFIYNFFFKNDKLQN